jgi:hypothetical protein
MIRESISLAFAMTLAAGGQPAFADWQCLSAGAKVPAAAQAASDYLERAERVYPTQVLGVLRAGDRVYLVNARDDGWSERVRLGLMELRLAEPDITAARRFQATLSGGPAPEANGIPAGEFVCLARERAARQGLAFRGEAVLLAAGKSVYLVDPIELAIVVEVRADGGQPLDLREIFAASARAGIYAGLFRGRAPSDPAVVARPPEVAVTFPVGPIGRPDGEVVITPRAVEGGKVEEKVVATGATDAPSVQAPAAVLAATAPPVAEESPARVVKADVPAAPPPVKPFSPEAPAAVVVEVAQPVSVAALADAPAAQRTSLVVMAAPAPPAAEEPPARVVKADVPAAAPLVKPLVQEAPTAVVVEVAQPVMIVASIGALPAQGTRPVAGQSYEDYATTMKAMMALRRSGGVRSISEMTYVHPAVEDLRARR